jgi:hypothetical protein
MIVMTDPGLTQDEQRTQDVEIALERARGHVVELRRLGSVGAPFTSLVPYLDQLEADLNTARPVHVGWANYQAPGQGIVSSPTGLSGIVEPSHVEGETPTAETPAEEVGDDGLTDTERAAQEHPAL